MASPLRMKLAHVGTAIAGPSRFAAAPCCCTRRQLHWSRARWAAVSGTSPDVLAASSPSSSSSSSASSSSATPAQKARNNEAPPSQRQSAVQAAKERKLREYEALLKQKAAERGFKSVEELKSKVLAEKAATQMNAALKPPSSAIEERDAKVAAEIRARAEAEAKRKLASGQLHPSSDGGKSAVKPLSQILDLPKLMQEPPERIQQLWTGYHAVKGKLSAVIPVATYERLISAARRYPQFVLPLPRTIVGGEEEALLEGEAAQQGYEMHFMEWGFLPPPGAVPGGDASAKVPSPTTVLFTPLAEYKLRQEFAQPLLILTHYTDLAHDKGVVLMRGEITGADEAQAAPTGVAAATAAAAAGASAEEQARLAQPLQSHSQGRMTQQDAQVLSMCLQRFYLPSRSDTGAELRQQLLEAFHKSPEEFDVNKLVDAAYTF